MNIQPLEIITATFQSYRKAASQASQSLKRNWLIMPASVLAYFALEIAVPLVSPLGIAGGFILGIFGIFLISLFYLWLEQAQERAPLKFQDLVRFDYGMFSAAISVAFILFLLRYITGMFGQTTGFPLTLFVNVGFFIACNAIPEVIYIQRYESLPAIKEAFEFTKNNWIEWFLPFIVLALPILLSEPTLLLALLTGAETMIPAKILIDVVTIGCVKAMALAPQLFENAQSLPTILHLMAIVIATWFMLFRGFLFHELNGGTRRQRIFAARQR
jgi:hypothetical protein